MNREKLLKIFYIVLLIHPFVDLATSLSTRFIDFPITIGIVFRGITFLILCIYVLFLSKSKYKKKSCIYLLVLFVLLFLYFITKIELITNFRFLFNEAIYMFKFMYFPVTFLGLLNLYDDIAPSNKKLFRYLHIIILVFAAVILLANLTGTSFNTYKSVGGNTGWYYSGNEIGGIFAILFPILLLVVNKESNISSLFIVLPVLFAVEMIGTKTSALGLILPTVLLMFYYLVRFKTKKRQLFVTIVLFMAICLTAQNLPVVENVKTSIARYYFRQTQEDDEYTKNMVASIALSDRDFYLKNIKKIYNNSSSIEKVFGIGFNNRTKVNDSNITKLIEMDFFEVYYRYGILIFIMYILPVLYVIKEIVCGLINKKLKINFKQLVLSYAFAIGIFISFLAGHIVSAPAVSIYLSLIMIMILYYYKNDIYTEKLEKDKITILALHLGIGGVEKYIYSLTEMLKSKYDIEIISTYKVLDKPAFNFDQNIKIKYLINDKPKTEEMKMALKSKKCLKFIKYFIENVNLYIQKYHKNIIAIENISSEYIITTRTFHNELASEHKARNIKLIVTEHNFHNNDKKYIKRFIHSCRNAQKIVLVSEELNEFYSNSFPTEKSKCIYIPNVIENIPKYSLNTKINNKLISVGRLAPEKGFDDLIDVIDIVKKDIPNIKLDIYGGGVLFESLNLKVKSLNLSNNINLNGFVSNDKIAQHMKESDLYVMTSHTESFGIVLLEAMSNSIPCIAFDSASGARKILSNANGILISNRDKNDMAKAIIEILSNNKIYAKLSKNGYESCLKYSIDNVKNDWLDLLKKM